MDERIIKRIAALLSVKSLVTIAMTSLVIVLAVRGTITGQDVMTIFLMVISFYFGTQSQKVQDVVDGGGQNGTA